MQDWNDEANDIYFQATQILNPRERDRFLEERCGKRSTLRQQVEEMLAIDSRAEEFFSEHESEVQELSNQICGTFAKWREGAVIDRYQLLQKIGEGGFALVFAANQLEHVERTVALKLIKPGMDTKEVIARFAAEQQALAMMDHPNIAKVLDAGTTDDGRPFFVMELVRGTPLTEFCDARNLSLAERLELFDSVCDAIHHAHQKGVIHRDVKPSNILVTLERDKPAPKVIDFGIAKALSRKLTEKTLFTRVGQVIGTPEYMSPEQADDDVQDVDTRSDIYSLGVLLYELVTGLTPIEGPRLRSAGWNEMARIIREDHVPRPSDRLSSIGKKQFALARQRSTEARSLRHQLRGELDWIVLKAIDKERGRRYQSASEFARDVRRYLSNDPVEARRPSTLYTFAKFVKRHRATVLAASLLAIAILGGLIASTVAWISADKAERQALLDRNKANQAAHQLGHSLYASILARAGLAIEDSKLTHAQELLEKSPPEHRDWEWQHLLQRSQSRYIFSAPDVMRAAYLPDGLLLVRIRDSNGLFILDPDTDQRRPTKLPAERYQEFAVSADGQLVFCSLLTGEFRVSELATGKELWRSEKFVQTGILHDSLGFSKNGTRVILKSSDGVVRVFDAASGDVLFEKPYFVPNCGAMLSPDGKQVSINDKIWDVDTDAVHADLRRPHDPSWHWIYYSGDGKLLARNTLGGSISVLHAETHELLFELHGHRGASFSAFGPNNELLVTTGIDGTHRLWDLRLGQQIRVLGAIDAHSGYIEVSPDGSQFFTIGITEGVKIWPIAASDILTLRGNGDMMRDAIFLPGKQPHVITSEVRGPVCLWDAATGKLERTFWVGANGSGVLAAHPNGRQFAIAIGGRIEIWNWQAGRRENVLAAHSDEITRMQFSPDGRWLLSLGANKLKIWDHSTGQLFREQANGSYITGPLSISPDGRWGAAVKISTPAHSADGKEVEVFDLRSGKVRKCFKPHRILVTALAFGEVDVGNGRPELILAVGHKDDHITLCDPFTGNVLKRLKGHASWCSSVAFNPEGTRV
ncbi:MAG: WD40 repeat domain-containing serine/threonine-protein kinase [Pirellulaceae bacterium]